MVSHVSYQEEHFTTSDRCLDAIRQHIERGWQVVQVRGPSHGPFVVMFGIDERQ